MPYNSVRYLKSILIFFFIASQIESVGQVFPVQSTVQLTPPYSLYLSDYAAPGSERLKITAFLLDASRPELNVRFRLRIEGNGIKIETKNEFLPPPVTLLGGVPLQLISSDLAAYFDPRNLNFSGITQREYEQRAALPEGLYQFCFEVLEYNRGVKISNTGCATAWLVLNDPPLVNLPRDNDKVRMQDPQQVVFQWTPRHRGSPNSAFNAEYDFKLVEVWPSTRNPNDAILTSPVIFQTTTSETTLIYGPAETPLEPGRRYAFQIRARAYAGADEVSLFKNNGLTQVSTFVYGDACLPPQNPVASDIGTTRFSVNFDAAPNQTGYSLRYRPIPNSQSPNAQSPSPNAQSPSSNWYTNTSLTPNLTITSLTPNTRYEYQVSSGCGSTTSDYSPLATVTTNPNPGIQYSCGMPLTPFNLDPSQLIETLKVGDVIKAGDFDVVLSKVTGSGGTFSGAGNIEVSYFNRAKVNAEFTNIKVSKELRLVDGYLNVTGASVEVVPAGFLKLMDDLTEVLDKADNKLDSLEKNRPTPFDENAAVTSMLITVPGNATVSQGSNGSVVIVDGNGQRTEIPAGATASVVDGTGKGYIVDSNGKVHTTTAAIAAQAANREYNLKLKFAASAEQKFGFDEKKYDPIATTYTKVEDQYLSWKSVATGQTDKVLAILEGTEFDKSKIRYELGGIALMPNAQSPIPNSPTPNSQLLELLGTADGLEEELIALYDPIPNSQSPTPNAQSPSSKTQVLGKLSVVTYNELVKDLVIVPVNGNKYPYGEDALRAQLNKIYGQAVVKWNITFAQNLDVPGIDPFDDGGSGLLSNYSPDMRKVVNAYKANLQPNTYYLFLVTNPKSSTLAGFMPRSKECGFIFVDSPLSRGEGQGGEAALIRTIAHELGHGAFSLRHTFAEEEKTMQEGTTDNLMDYTLAGTALYKYQWDRMRYPEIVMGLFEDDKDGAFAVQIAQCLTGAALDFTFYYSSIWVSMLLDETIPDNQTPSFTDFSAITHYKDFSWTEALVSAGISCAAATLPPILAPETSRTMVVGAAALGGTLTGFATETAKQYEISYAKQKKETTNPSMVQVVKGLEWPPIIKSAATTGLITGVATFLATSPKFGALKALIKQRLKINDLLSEKQKLIDFLENRFAKKVQGAGNNWITFIGKNIDELAEAPLGYQFYNYNGKKFLRRVNAADDKTPRLTVTNGKVVKYDGQTISNLSTTQVIDLAISSTKNPTSLKGIMLGKYDADLAKVSYNRVGKDNGYTYFEMDNWDGIYKLVNESRNEMWKINEQVIKNQFNSNKPFYFSHNPNDIQIVGQGTFYEQEIDLIKQLVQQKYGRVAKFNPSNQYWKLEW